jgi:hypothetical protein
MAVGPASSHRALQPGTEQRVDIELGLARQTAIVLDDTTGVTIRGQTQGRLAARPICLPELTAPVPFKTIGTRQPRHHIAIAAIVARPRSGP